MRRGLELHSASASSACSSGACASSACAILLGPARPIPELSAPPESNAASAPLLQLTPAPRPPLSPLLPRRPLSPDSPCRLDLPTRWGGDGGGARKQRHGDARGRASAPPSSSGTRRDARGVRLRRRWRRRRGRGGGLVAVAGWGRESRDSEKNARKIYRMWRRKTQRMERRGAGGWGTEPILPGCRSKSSGTRASTEERE